MSSKNILVGVVAAVVVNTAAALPVNDKTVSEKSAQADTISQVIANMVPTINSPECSVHHI